MKQKVAQRLTSYFGGYLILTDGAVCNVRQSMNESFENFEQVMLNLAGTQKSVWRSKKGRNPYTSNHPTTPNSKKNRGNPSVVPSLSESLRQEPLGNDVLEDPESS